MKPHRSILIVLTSVFMLGLIAAFWPSGEVAEAQDNLLRNPNFDLGFYPFSGNSSIQPPNEWAPWWNNNTDGCYNVAPRMNAAQGSQRVRSGNQAASVWYNGGFSYEAGILQVVQGVQPGTIYRFTVWGQGWQTDTPESKSTSDANASIDMKIGIDPNGLNIPTSGDIVWSGTKSPMDNYEQFSVEATANGSQITVFVYSRPPFCVNQSDTYWDDAQLVAIGQGEPPPAEENNGGGEPAPQADSGDDTSLSPSVSSVQVSPPDETGRQVHTVRANENLTIIALAYDTTITEIRSKNDLSGGLRVGMELLIREGGAPPPAVEETGEESAEESTEEDTAPEEEEPEEEAEPESPGTICIIHYEDADGNGTRAPGEVPLNGVTFAVSDGNFKYGEYTADGTTDSYCFNDLAPGSYIVSWIGGYTAVSAQAQRAEVGSGETVTREFGAYSGTAAMEEGSGGGGLFGGGNDASQAGGATPEGEQSDGIPTALIIVVGVLGVLFLLGGAGSAAYFLLMRGAEAEEIE